jgi:hypothetical protein
MDEWKTWNITTCLINCRSVLSTVLEFFNPIEVSGAFRSPPLKGQVEPQDQEFPKSVVDLVIRADIHRVCAQLDSILHDCVAYGEFSKARGDDAQQLLDLLQDVSP